MTISVEVASLTENVQDSAQFLRKSDIALYQAKQQGRNRVAGIGENAAELKQEINYQV